MPYRRACRALTRCVKAESAAARIRACAPVTLSDCAKFSAHSFVVPAVPAPGSDVRYRACTYVYLVAGAMRFADDDAPFSRLLFSRSREKKSERKKHGGGGRLTLIYFRRARYTFGASQLSIRLGSHGRKLRCRQTAPTTYYLNVHEQAKREKLHS